MICNALDEQPMPIYGDGAQVRDWLYVDDHCRAIRAVLEGGRLGEVYNIGGNRALANLEVVYRILEITDRPESLLMRVQDRPGHDRRYALSSEKLMRETSWRPEMEFEDGLAATVAWYQEQRGWVDRVKSGAYRDYYTRNYAARPEELRRMRAVAAVPPVLRERTRPGLRG
jgi:dTDP-glucose 4,6-dehydratase